MFHKSNLSNFQILYIEFKITDVFQNTYNVPPSRYILPFNNIVRQIFKIQQNRVIYN